MPVSVYDILELNGRKPTLNCYLKFFTHEGKQYAYLNRKPYRISFMELGGNLKEILQQFDGTRTVNEIIHSNSLDGSFFDLLKILSKNSLLADGKEPEAYPESGFLTLLFFPTNNCNLKCKYCYISDGAGVNLTINIKKAEAWIDYVLKNRGRNIKKINVMFHGGGEPTIAFEEIKSIWAIVKKRCEDEKLQTELSCITNGNFNNSVLEWFIRERAQVFFSIDGRKEDHDKLRPYANGKGSFDKAYYNLKKLREAGLKTIIRATASAVNKENLKDVVDLAGECGADFVALEQCNSFGRDMNKNETTLSYEEFIEAYLDIWKYAVQKGVNLRGSSSISILPGRNYFCNNYSKESLHLTSEGYLSPCSEVCVQSDPVSRLIFMGKIDDDNSILFFDEKIIRLRQRNLEIIAECRDCFMEYTCNGGCPVRSYRENGNLFSTSIAECNYLREISARLLTTLLYEHKKYPDSDKFEYLDYHYQNGKELYTQYISFN